MTTSFLARGETMRKYIVGVLLCLGGGCGTQPVGRVTEALREACLFALESEIEAKITGFQILQGEGFTEFEVLELIGEVCAAPDPTIELLCGPDLLCRDTLQGYCVTCNMAVLEAVYD